MSPVRGGLIALACLVLAGTLLSSCRSRKQIPTGARELAPVGAPALLIDVPADYHIDARKGVDFDVFYLQREKTEKGDPPKDGMGIYVGHAPSFSPPKDAQTASGTISGRKVTWYAWEDDSGDRTLLRMQTLIPGFFAGAKDQAGGVAGLQVHIFIWAPGEKRLGILRDAAETLRLK